MGGCGLGKTAAGDAKKWEDAAAKAKAQEAQEAEAAASAEAAQAATSADDEPLPQTAAEEFGGAPPPPPMRLESLQEALAASLRVDANQLMIIGRFWDAVGLDDAFPKEPLQLSIDGDASALQLALTLSPDQILDAIPAFLSLAPNARPSPPGPRGEAIQRPARQLQPEMAFAAMPPELLRRRSVPSKLQMPVEAPGRPVRQLHPEVLLGMAPPQGLSSWLDDDLQPSKPPPITGAAAETLPTLVSTGERPRGKAKAKSKVIRENGISAPASASSPAVEVVTSAPQLLPPPTTDYAQPPLQHESKEFSPEPRSELVAPRLEMATSLEAELRPNSKPEAPMSVGGPSAELEALQKKMQDQDELDTPGFDGMADGSIAPARAQAPTETKKAIAPARAPAPTETKNAIDKIQVAPSHVEPRAQSDRSAALQWEETLTRAIEELASPQVVLWLHLGGLGLPNGVDRPVDVGVRLPTASGTSDSFQIVQPYQDVSETLDEVGVTSEGGWVVSEMGCSFFAHGPLVTFAVTHSTQGQLKQNSRCEKLLEKVVPASLVSVARAVAGSKGMETSVRIGLKDGDVCLGACFEFSKESKEKSSKLELQSMAVDLALGKQKVFDAFMVERTRQMFASLGAHTVVSAIECRANDTALVTLSVSPTAKQ